MKKISFKITKRNCSPVIINIMLGVFVFILSFLVYLLTLAPTVTAEDSGELITASYFLGIPHPPGYPTWCLLSHPFTYIPLGNIAWRVNLSSAFFASNTVLFVFLFLLRITKNRISALSSSLIFAFSLEFWEQSVITEVYSLNSLFIILCFYFLILWKDTNNSKYLLWLSFIYGISLGNHYTMFVVGPFLVAFIIFTNPDNLRYKKIYFLCVVIVLFSWCLVCSYLYIRSLANPPIDWGNPENFKNLFHLITRKQYSFMLTQYPRSFSRLLRQCFVFFGMGISQFGSPLLFFLSLLSFFLIFFRHREWSLLLFSTGFFTGFFAILVQNFN
ncbi:MAG: glycosyltransferase family 117 protein, partial [Candidatus Hydrogenedens sp.]